MQLQGPVLDHALNGYGDVERLLWLELSAARQGTAVDSSCDNQPIPRQLLRHDPIVRGLH